MKLLKKLAKKRLIQIITILCIVIIGSVIWLSKWSNEPATTTIHIADNSSAASTTATYQPFRSKLFTSEVPSGWVIKKNTDTPSLTQLVSFPNGSSINHGQIAVTVDTLTAGGLSAVPDYNLRAQDKINYQRQTTNLTGVSATFLDVNNGPGYSAFMTHDSRYAVVTVSQFTTSDEAYTQLKDVVSHWEWK